MLAGEQLVNFRDGDALRVAVCLDQFPTLAPPRFGLTGRGAAAVPAGVRVLSYDPATGEVYYAPVTRVAVARSRPCVRVRTARGRQVVAAADAPLCAFDPAAGRLAGVHPSDAVGRLVPVIRTDPEVGTGFNRDLGWWYASLVSDGWKNDKVIGYAKNSDAQRAEFVRIARAAVCPDFRVSEYREQRSAAKFADSVKVHLTGQGLLAATLDVVRPHPPGAGRAALYKTIPAALLAGGSRDCLLGLLAGLLEGDGSLHRTATDRVIVRVNTSSRQLTHDVTSLCQKLGIRVTVVRNPARGPSRESYFVYLSVVDVWPVLLELTFVTPEARAAVAAILGRAAPAKDDVDIVPITRAAARSLSRACRAAGEATLYSTLRLAMKRGRVGRASLLRALALPRPADPGVDRAAAVANDHAIHWDVIRAVEPTGPEPVFGLVVPATGVFALANGLVVWGQEAAPVRSRVRGSMEPVAV